MSGITTIVHFSMPRENMDAFLDTWGKSQAIMVAQPGARDNVLHRTLDEDSPFQFINVAHWDSAETLAAALKASVEGRRAQGDDVQADFQRLGVRMSQNNYEEWVRNPVEGPS